MDEPMFINAQVEEGDLARRHESVERCNVSLVHACQCRDADCGRISCQRLKRVVQHLKTCQQRINSTCAICKNLIALFCYHAKRCPVDSCTVPLCMHIRQKLAEKEAAQKRTFARREMVMRRRIELLQLDARNINGSQSGI